MPCPHDRLAQGRYRWRHDIVLMELADTLELEKKEEKKHQEKGMPSNQFCQGRSDRQENKGPNYINP